MGSGMQDDAGCGMQEAGWPGVQCWPTWLGDIGNWLPCMALFG